MISSVSSAPTGFKTAFQDAVKYFDATFSNPVTVNIDVGWGEVGGSSISAGALGESETYLAGYYSYGQVRNALISDARSAADQSAVASLPAADPTGGRSELMATSEAKALGLTGYSGTDGFVGFDKSSPWTFNPASRGVGGAFDFIGVAEHEVSEVLGRMADLGTIGGTLDPLDLFRYSAPNTRALSPGNGQYFSINGGAANLDTYNGTGGGDLGDWAGYALDAFDAAVPPGVVLPLSTADVDVFDVLGYNLTGQQNGPAQSRRQRCRQSARRRRARRGSRARRAGAAGHRAAWSGPGAPPPPRLTKAIVPPELESLAPGALSRAADNGSPRE